MKVLKRLAYRRIDVQDQGCCGRVLSKGKGGAFANDDDSIIIFALTVYSLRLLNIEPPGTAAAAAA